MKLPAFLLLIGLNVVSVLTQSLGASDEAKNQPPASPDDITIKALRDRIDVTKKEIDRLKEQLENSEAQLKAILRKRGEVLPDASEEEMEENSEWGSIRGRIAVDGPVPARPPLVAKGNNVVRDSDVCGADDIPDESMIVDAESRGIANVVIYLAKKPTAIHPDLVDSAEKEVVFDQKGCRFVPHVMIVRTDQKVRCISDDPIAHNVHTFAIKNPGTNMILGPLDRKGIAISSFQTTERLPFQIQCDIHPWMRAWWMVLDHPYAAVTDSHGRFEIANLPVGEHEFTIWQERAGYLKKSHKVVVKPGKNLLPTMMMSADKLKR